MVVFDGMVENMSSRDDAMAVSKISSTEAAIYLCIYAPIAKNILQLLLQPLCEEPEATYKSVSEQRNQANSDCLRDMGI